MIPQRPCTGVFPRLRSPAVATLRALHPQVWSRWKAICPVAAATGVHPTVLRNRVDADPDGPKSMRADTERALRERTLAPAAANEMITDLSARPRRGIRG